MCLFHFVSDCFKALCFFSQLKWVAQVITSSFSLFMNGDILFVTGNILLINAVYFVSDNTLALIEKSSVNWMNAF